MRTILLPALALVLAGCPKSDPCADNPSSCLDGAACNGQCAPFVQLAGSGQRGWRADFTLWTGPSDSTPPLCPDGGPGQDGYLDAPAASANCGACSCLPSQGDCGPGWTLTAHADTCAGSGAAVTFDPVEYWGGGCDATNPIPGGVCAQCSPSLTTARPVFWSNVCPSNIGPSTFAGKTNKALVCTFSEHYGGGCLDGQMCVGPKSANFAACIWQPDDVSCPEGWPVKHVYYPSDELCDCSCSAPVGESCTGTLSVYEDDACSKLLTTIPVSSNEATTCAAIPAATPLGSKSAELTYNPGTCAPSFKKGTSYPVTFCCLP